MKFCEQPFKYAYLAEKGEVWPCGWMHYAIGNLYEQDMDEIWHSEAAQAARQTILDGSFAFCRKQSCPYCEQDSLPDLTAEEIKEKAVPSQTPQFINMANDHICNIACTNCRTSIYCPEEGERQKIDRVLERLLPVANKAEWMSMNGGGEFLANSSFVRFLNKLQPENPGFKISFETNGVLFDENHWSHFAHLGSYNISVTVTINSLRKEVYRYLSGGFDHLHQVLDNMRFLSKLRRENKLNSLSVTMVVQEANCWEVPEFIHRFSRSEEFAVDTIVMKPLYKWWHMEEGTYWFKNILNPLHPYHKEYLKILADDCWNDPKVYDWGCHNIREALPHPLEQEKIYNQLLLRVFQNEQDLAPSEFLKACVARAGGGRIGYYGKNEFSKSFVKMLQKSGVDVAFELTWVKEDNCGDIPKVAKQEFKPEMADMILLIDFFKGGYWRSDLPAMGFQGPILSVKELIDGEA